MKRLTIFISCLLVAGCTSITSGPTYARIYDHQDPIRVITDEEIALLPERLSLNEMHERFGRSIRCEVNLGIYPRFSSDLDYSKALGEKATESVFMFIPDVKSEGMISAIARIDKSEAIIIWPKESSGLTLERYWNPQK